MHIKLDETLAPKFALITCRGTWDNAELMTLWERVFLYASENKRNAVLVDLLGLTGTPPNIMDRYDHAVKVAEVQKRWGQGIAIAVVGSEPYIEPERFAELIFTQHGGMGKVFTELEAAVGWLATNPASATISL